jgi:hypothetical protein
MNFLEALARLDQLNEAASPDIEEKILNRVRNDWVKYYQNPKMGKLLEVLFTTIANNINKAGGDEREMWPRTMNAYKGDTISYEISYNSADYESLIRYALHKNNIKRGKTWKAFHDVTLPDGDTINLSCMLNGRYLIIREQKLPKHLPKSRIDTPKVSKKPSNIKDRVYKKLNKNPANYEAFKYFLPCNENQKEFIMAGIGQIDGVEDLYNKGLNSNVARKHYIGALPRSWIYKVAPDGVKNSVGIDEDTYNWNTEELVWLVNKFLAHTLNKNENDPGIDLSKFTTEEAFNTLDPRAVYLLFICKTLNGTLFTYPSGELTNMLDRLKSFINAEITESFVCEVLSDFGCTNTNHSGGANLFTVNSEYGGVDLSLADGTQIEIKNAYPGKNATSFENAQKHAKERGHNADYVVAFLTDQSSGYWRLFGQGGKLISASDEPEWFNKLLVNKKSPKLI